MTEQPPPGPAGRAYWLERYAAARAGRRRRVLQWPDLVQQLRERPLQMSDPQTWTGYVPPAMWDEQPNESPQYLALARICGEAKRREREGMVPPR